MDVEHWFESGFPLVVVEQNGEVVGWASAPPYREREAYEGVREFSVYVARSRHGEGLGRAAMLALISECRARGYRKLVSRIFPENEASRAVCSALGFREVGVSRRHAKLDGEWRDCVIVELLLDN